MSLSQKKLAPPSGEVAASLAKITKQVTTKSRGDKAEVIALAYLRQHGLNLVQANYRTPGRGGGEVDLIMREPDGTLVFIEVRQRTGLWHGGAGASITTRKQRRIILAARHYLMRLPSLPPCRFDALLIHGALAQGASLEDCVAQVEWLPSAFDAG